MKKIILLIAFTISSSNLLSQKDTKILVTINDNEFSVADFKKVYEKNITMNQCIWDVSKKHSGLVSCSFIVTD